MNVIIGGALVLILGTVTFGYVPRFVAATAPAIPFVLGQIVKGVRSSR